MKLIKFLFKTVIVLLVLVLALVLTTPLWVGPLATCGANAIVPKYTGTAFHVEDIAFNPYSGRFQIDNLDLPNPEKARVEKAATLGTLRVVVDPLTVLSDEIVIRELTIKDLYVSYIGYQDPMNAKFDGSNFDWIAENASRGKPAEETPAEEPVEEAKEEGSGPNVVIEKLSLSGVKLHYGYVEIPLPTINLRDVGKKSEGMKLADIPGVIIDAIKVATEGAIDLTGLVGDGILKVGGVAFDMATDAAAEVVDALKNIDLNAVGEKIGEMGGAVLDAAKNVDVGAAADAAKEAVGNVASSLGDAAGSALETVKSVDVGGAVDSAMESIKSVDMGGAVDSAMESIKSVDVGGAVDSAMESVKGIDLGSVGESIGNAAGSAAGAVGDAAGAAKDAAGSLLKGAGSLFK